MKKFILVSPTCPGSHHMVKVMRINIDHIVAFGNATEGCGYIETTNNWIITKESYNELYRMISEALE